MPPRTASPQPRGLRTSERKDFRRCPWLWEQSWLNGLKPRRAPTWAIFGTAVHKGLETYYRKGVRRGRKQDAVDAFLDNIDLSLRKVGIDLSEVSLDDDGIPEEGTSKATAELVAADELGEAMLWNYFDTYGNDSDWEVIHTEQPFQIDVPHPTKPGKTLVVYMGTWDALMRHRPTGKFWLWDHKTAKSLPNIQYLELDDQAGSYLWVAKEVLVHKGIFTKKDTIEGIVFNYLKKAKPDARPVDSNGHSLNLDGSVSKRQPAPRFLRHPAARTPHQIVEQARRVQAEAQHMEAMRTGVLPIYKNPTMDCPRCPLFDLCTLHEAGDDWEDYRDALFVVRDPYADHREAMAENGIVLTGGRSGRSK